RPPILPDLTSRQAGRCGAGDAAQYHRYSKECGAPESGPGRSCFGAGRGDWNQLRPAKRARVCWTQGAGRAAVDPFDQRPDTRACGELWMVRHHRQAVVPGHAVPVRACGSELGLGDPAADAGHQPGDAADALPDDEVIVEDAAYSAADGCHQGQVLEVQGYRSAQAGNAEGDVRAAEVRGREYVRRVPADAHFLSAALRLLRGAGKCD